jgi:hypothetical protein
VKDGICALCSPPPIDALDAGSEPIGYCTSCNYFFDRHGMRILDITVTCPVHDTIISTCPHSRSLR